MSRTNSISAIDAINTFLDTLRDLGYTPEEVKKALVYFAGSAPSQPLVEVQEPKAWLTKHDSGDMVWTDKTEAEAYCDDAGPIPLYAAPVRGLPLTPAQIKHAIDRDPTVLTQGLLTAFCKGVRFAEKTHGISSPAPGGDGED